MQIGYTCLKRLFYIIFNILQLLWISKIEFDSTSPGIFCRGTFSRPPDEHLQSTGRRLDDFQLRLEVEFIVEFFRNLQRRTDGIWHEAAYRLLRDFMGRKVHANFWTTLFYEKVTTTKFQLLPRSKRYGMPSYQIEVSSCWQWGCATNCEKNYNFSFFKFKAKIWTKLNTTITRFCSYLMASLSRARLSLDPLVGSSSPCSSLLRTAITWKFFKFQFENNSSYCVLIVVQRTSSVLRHWESRSQANVLHCSESSR